MINSEHLDKWVDRVQNLLDVQKELGLDLISTNFARYELVELRLILNTLLEIEEGRNHV